ncbi:SPOR domain-containing protein [Microvirga antarctica]|uniref:SPOR domain-containing protein n=1 Tax=Microvirga antarctica TaxID=2819233 RepID=UPI003CCEBB84
MSLVIAMASPADAARRKKAGGGYNPPTASIVVDAKTGKVLESENADAQRHPASITKVMTLYLLFEQLEAGKVRLNTPLQISAYAARQSPSKLGLPAGRTIEVEDAILALVTKSANDIAVVVAENIAGSEDAFAEQMTRKARQLGMSRTIYRNASGLPDPEQVTTARDLSVLGRAIQDRFPKYYTYFNTRVFNFAGSSIRNHNRLLGRIEGVDGIKTGFIGASGFNILTNVKTDNRHVVAVVLGGRSAASRDNTMAALIGSNLPRAYAGARVAPPVGEGGAREVMVADASPSATIPVQAAPAPEPVAVAPPAAPARKALDLNTLRPVVASATGASGTTTPSSSGVRWQKGAQPLPLNAQAYAALQEADEISETQKLALAAKIEPRVPATPPTPVNAIKTASVDKVEVSKARVDTAKAEPETAKPSARQTVSGWVIQLGATDDEEKAKAVLDRAGKILPKASPFTEKVTVGGNTLYRARFSGFEEPDAAQNACKTLKKSGFACFASRA